MRMSWLTWIWRRSILKIHDNGPYNLQNKQSKRYINCIRNQYKWISNWQKVQTFDAKYSPSLVKVSVPGNQFIHGLNVGRHKCDDGLEPPGLWTTFPWKRRIVQPAHIVKHGLRCDLLHTNTCCVVGRHNIKLAAGSSGV